MDLVENLGDLGHGQTVPVATILPSRTVALGECREALDEGNGPLLLTGEAGVGKTWLCQRIAEQDAGSDAWVRLDLSPTLTPTGLFERIGQGLRLPELGQRADPRRALTEELIERRTDGCSIGLIVEEAHNGTAALLEEIRLLSSGLGRPDGFRSMVLVGLTGLAQRLETRPLAALRTRLSGQVHLRSIDVEEARLLLAALIPDRSWSWPVVEAIHRDSAGNPRRLLRWARRGSNLRVERSSLLPKRARTPARSTRIEPEPSLPIAPSSAGPSEVELPNASSCRPPLRAEEGLIEVGWAPEPAIVGSQAPAETIKPVSLANPLAPSGPEPILDRYAAIQVWNEWSGGGNLDPLLESVSLEEADGKLTPLGEAVAKAEIGASVRSAGGQQIRAENHQAFAPYSQLFSRLQSSKGSD
ncbi:hypothetical protein BH23PLA1_BH23PLA1_22590 [soil metagenome]